jgi:hypothetical protein
VRTQTRRPGTVRHEIVALLTVSSALIPCLSGREGSFLHIATKTGWEDRISLLPIWDEWRTQAADAQLLFVEESITYIYFDFVAHCEGARPSVFPPSLLRSSQLADSSRRLRLGLVPAAPLPYPHAPAESHEPLGTARPGARQARAGSIAARAGLLPRAAVPAGSECRRRRKRGSATTARVR